MPLASSPGERLSCPDLISGWPLFIPSSAVSSGSESLYTPQLEMGGTDKIGHHLHASTAVS